MTLDWVPYNYYPVQKDKEVIQTLINFGNKVNIITATYACKLNLRIQQIDVGTQKIDDSSLETCKMVLPVSQW